METRKLLALFALALVTASAAFAGKPRVQDDMEAKWMAFMTPGTEHKVLDTRLGLWNGQVKMWMTPDAPPVESACTSKYEWALGNRYLLNETHGEFMGMPFEGRGITAFDNLTRKYVSTWIDTMGTGIMVAQGSYDAHSKTFTYQGEGPDVMAGKYTPVTSIERDVDGSSWVMEMHATDPATGKLFKTMEITYRKAQ